MCDCITIACAASRSSPFHIQDVRCLYITMGGVLYLQLPVTGCSCHLQVYSRLSTFRRKSYPQPTITSPHLSCGLFYVLYTGVVNILYLILNVLQSYPHFYALKYMLVTQEADATGLPVFPFPVMRMVWIVVCRDVDSCL